MQDRTIACGLRYHIKPRAIQARLEAPRAAKMSNLPLSESDTWVILAPKTGSQSHHYEDGGWGKFHFHFSLCRAPPQDDSDIHRQRSPTCVPPAVNIAELHEHGNQKRLFRIPTMSDIDRLSDEHVDNDTKTPGAPGTVVVAEDPAAPSREVSSKRQSLSDLFTIVCGLTSTILIEPLYQRSNH